MKFRILFAPKVKNTNPSSERMMIVAIFIMLFSYSICFVFAFVFQLRSNSSTCNCLTAEICNFVSFSDAALPPETSTLPLSTTSPCATCSHAARVGQRLCKTLCSFSNLASQRSTSRRMAVEPFLPERLAIKWNCPDAASPFKWKHGLRSF